nr:hypothetical protein MACL_00002290 [Theileria orientalis]
MIDNDLESWEAYRDSDQEDADPAKDASLEELSDKLKSQKLSEDSDLHFTNDLFSGYSNIKPESSDNLFSTNAIKQIALADPFSQIELKCLKDCETTSKKLSQKIDASPAKSGVWLQFLDILLQACEKKMDIKDLQTYKRKVENFIKAKEATHRDKSFNKKKPNGTVSCPDPCVDIPAGKNYQDELDMLYGELSDTDEVNH